MFSHELRSPLNSIKASLRLVAGGMAGNQEQTNDLLHIALDECDRLIRLINDILDIRKIEAGKLELKLEPIDPVDLIDGIVMRTRNIAMEAEITLVIQESKCPPVLADRDRILQ